MFQTKKAYMFNFFSSYYFYLCFCFFIQTFSFNSGLEAKTYSSSNYELNFDVDAIINSNSLDDQIDNFINIGIQYQQATSKSFKYKKFLKEAYKYLESHDAHVDKKMKKDLKKCIQNRISSRFFADDKAREITGHCAVASSKNPKGEYSNEFMQGIMEVAIGGIGIAYGSPTVKATGVGLVGDGLRRFSNATIDYLYPESKERESDRPKERESRDGVAHEMDRQGSRG
jgi:hypothetical protein